MKMKKIFVVLTHVFPPEGSDLHKLKSEGYKLERCEVVTRITNKQTQEATFIIDAIKKSVVKSRNPALDYDCLYNYFKRKYPAHDIELVKLLDNKE